SPWTSAWSFTTYTPPVPSAPTLSSPANGTTDEVTLITLSWNSATYATSYIYQVSTNSNFSQLFKHDSTASTACIINGLLENTYYWRVKSKNVSGRSGWSSAWSFSIVEPSGSDPCASYSSMSAMDEFTVSDLDGNQQVLYVINNGRALEKHLDKDWEMPPDPLEGIFGARFHSGKYIEDIPLKEKNPKEIKIKVKDASYLLTLHWKLQGDNNIKYWLTKWNGNGKIQLTDETGSYVIESPGGNGKKGGDIIIEATSSDPCLPTEKARATRPSEEVLAGIPLVTELKQNYPNPFNPITVIHYSLAEDSWVSLKVYNIFGQEVAVLVDESASGGQKAGYKSVMLDGTNLGTGVYFYQMKTKSYTASRKLLLMK
ncbi:MAG: T9SS type A sorting domain-containing protein, partial [Ignavibacteriales bacterium]|nr:T9SS type A sorting domain-containing protein [Ignavibacteriales bacterium]